MSDLNESSQIKITLTGRRPVNIDPEAWPVIAVATDKEFDNQYEFQANRISKWTLKVREHARGCALVYGIYTYNSNWQNAHCYDIRGGQRLSPGADLPRAIAEVAAWMESAVVDDMPDDAGTFRRLANECIGDLPAEDCDCEGSDLAVIV
jgi:hypothetical protein